MFKILGGILYTCCLFAYPSQCLQAKSEVAIEKKIGQMLLLGFRGTEISPTSSIARIIQDLHIGGIILFDFDVPSQSFPRNILNPEQTQRLIANLQSLSKIPLFIAVDAEGGRVNRLKEKYGFLAVPSAQQMQEKGVSQSRKVYSALAQQLARLGFNLNLAPVVDLNLNPDNPIIGRIERSFSDNPQIVTQQAQVFIETHQKFGIITALKHYPGHGSSRADSHLGMVDVTHTYKQTELQPYQELINKNVAQVILTAHVINTHIDPDYPATLSRAHLRKMLRRQLGFQGVIISDDVQMGAIIQNYGFAEALILAVNAGCNILALANNGETYSEDLAFTAHKILMDAVKTGKIPVENINDSYQRIMQLKQRFKRISRPKTGFQGSA